MFLGKRSWSWIPDIWVPENSTFTLSYLISTLNHYMLWTGKRQYQYDGVIQVYILSPSLTKWSSWDLVPVPEGWQEIWMGKNGGVPDKAKWLCVFSSTSEYIKAYSSTLGRTNEQFGGSWTCNSCSNSRWQLRSGCLLSRFIGCTRWNFSSEHPEPGPSPHCSLLAYGLTQCVPHWIALSEHSEATVVPDAVAQAVIGTPENTYVTHLL